MSVATAIFNIGGDYKRKEKKKEDSDGGCYHGSRVWEDTMREACQKMAQLYAMINDAEERSMVRFLLSVVSNVCRMEPTPIVR